jgi:hypothetical protein
MPPRLRLFRPDERIAIAIPTKNRPTYLSALLASLVEQTVQNWLLVINDSSQPPVQVQAAIRDLLTLVTARRHPVQVIRTDTRLGSPATRGRARRAGGHMDASELLEVP